MKTEEIEKLIAIFEASKVASMELETADFKLKLSKEGAVSKTEVVVENKKEEETLEEETGNFVTSPLVGTFHEAPYPNAEPFVKVGTPVKKGDKLCIIEAMKVMSEIKSPYDGIVQQIYVENGMMVEYGQKLFEIR